MKRISKFIIPCLVVLNACAPAVQDRAFEQPAKTFGPRFGDTDLSGKMKPSDRVNASLSWQGVVPTSLYFEQAENLFYLGNITGRTVLSGKGLSWIEKFYQQPQTASYAEFSQSPFASLAATSTEAEVQKSLKEIHRDLDHSRAVLKTQILAIGKKYPWPSRAAALTAVIDQASNFVDVVYHQIAFMGLPQVIADGVRAELKKQTASLFADLREVTGQLYSTKLFSKALDLLDKVIARFQVSVPSDVAKSLKQGRVIADDLDKMKDPQSGLTLLIDVWKILEPQERETYFKAENESLYDFLLKQDDDSLNCLRREGCSGGFFKGIAKKIFILPRIEEYGVQNLHAKLNEKTLARLIAEIESFAQTFLTSLPETFVQQIDQGLVAKDKELQGIQKNYSGYLNQLLDKWASKTLPNYKGKITGFEAPSLNLKISSQSKLSLSSAGDALDLKASTAGSSMAANALLLKAATKSTDFKVQTALSQVNKLIAIGGYRNDENKLVPAILSPIEKTSAPLDLMNFTKTQVSYRIPDKIKMLDSFRVSETPYAKDFSAAAYAEQIRGLSQMLYVTADWKKTGFDETLGKIRAQELTKEIETPSLDRALFPKDLLFALNLGDAAVLLKNITKKATPVFLITLDNKTIWADQYVSGGADTPIMAGLVDIKDGKRSNTVQSQDVAKFLLAISEFIKATEGAEQTKSSLLLEKDETGHTPLEALQEGRKDLKLLVVALANFISNQLMGEDSLVKSAYFLNQMQRSNDPAYRLEDQIYAVRALVAAWELTHLDPYMNAAQEIYFSMNKNAFSIEESFYINGDGSSLSFPQKVHALRAMSEIKAYLPVASQAQVDKISAPWLKSLEDLQ